MEITRTQRQEAEERASTIQLSLYAEPEAGEQLWNIATKFGLTERGIYFTFTQLIGDVILGFYKQEDIPALIASKLPQIQGVQRIGLEADIKMFLYPLSAEVEVLDPTPNPTLQSEIAETEKEIQNIQGIRTMAQDIKEAHQETTYQSTQDDLIRPPTTPPTQQPTTAVPKWETDTRG